MGGKKYHKDKDVHDVVDGAVRSGRWRWVPNKGKNHIKGVLYCGYGERGGCIVNVASTPRNPSTHARKLSRLLDRCPH